LCSLVLFKKIFGAIKVGGEKQAEEGERKRSVEEKEIPSQPSTRKIYLKALTLHSPEEIENVKSEIKLGNILIIRIEPLVRRSAEDARRVVNELSEFAASVGGDIARLGEERIILTPSSVQIWREKSSDSAPKM